MRILVAYASRRGSTKGIAERIAVTIEAPDLDVMFLPFHEVSHVDEFDAFVLGSSAYFGHWEPDASAFVRQNAAVLADRPVWMFSSGPIGTETVDKHGRHALESSRPAEFNEFEGLIHPRGMRVFFGAYNADGKQASLLERLVTQVPAIHDAMPTGDFRDWPEIVAWANEIATAVRPTPAMAGAD